MSEALPRATTWVPPSVDGPIVGAHRRREDLDALESQAWNEGFAAGQTAGLEAARQQQQALIVEQQRGVQRLAAICNHMVAPLQELDEEVVRQLAELAVAIARQVVRREIRTQPEQVIALIREVLALLPGNAREVRVFLHPADAALVRERLSEGVAESAWSLVEDPVLSRGGCRLQSQNSSIDARLETRLAAAITAVLGDDRQDTRTEQQE